MCCVLDARYESNILKFLNFAIYVSDAKLAHVVLTTSHAFSRNILDTREHAADAPCMMLVLMSFSSDADPGWKNRREVVPIAYANADTLRSYLRHEVGELLKVDFFSSLHLLLFINCAHLGASRFLSVWLCVDMLCLAQQKHGKSPLTTREVDDIIRCLGTQRPLGPR